MAKSLQYLHAPRNMNTKYLTGDIQLSQFSRFDNVCMYVCSFVYFDDFLTLRYRWNIYILLSDTILPNASLIYFCFTLRFPFRSFFLLKLRDTIWQNCSHLLVRFGDYCKYLEQLHLKLCLTVAEYHDPDISLTSICFSLSCFMGIVLFCSRFNLVSVRMQF